MTSSKSSHNLLTLESLTAQYILVCHVRMTPNSSLLVASEPLAENIHLSSFELCWCLYTKSMYHKHTHLFPGFYFHPPYSILHVPIHTPHCINYCSLVRSFKSESTSLCVVILLTFYLNILCLCVSKRNLGSVG